MIPGEDDRLTAKGRCSFREKLMDAAGGPWLLYDRGTPFWVP